MEPRRIGRHRHSGAYLHDGTAQRPDYRIRAGAHGRRVIPHPARLPHDAATHLARGVHRGDGYAGRQCRRHHGRHPDRPKTGTCSEKLSLPHRAQYGHAAVGRYRHCRFDVPLCIPFARYGRRIRQRPLLGIVRQSADKLGAGFGASSRLRQVMAAETGKIDQKRIGCGHELARASRRAAHDRAANRPQAHDHRCGVRCAVALHLRHDEGKEPLFPRFRLQTVRRRVLLSLGI